MGTGVTYGACHIKMNKENLGRPSPVQGCLSCMKGRWGQNIRFSRQFVIFFPPCPPPSLHLPQEMVIEGLKPDTTYSITVAAYTTKGDGARSKPKLVVTKSAGQYADKLSFLLSLCSVRHQRRPVLPVWSHPEELLISPPSTHSWEHPQSDHNAVYVGVFGIF